MTAGVAVWSRRVVGWALETGLVLRAWAMARRQPAAELLQPVEQGSQDARTR